MMKNFTLPHIWECFDVSVVIDIPAAKCVKSTH